MCTVKLNSDYWDCECEENYIHKKNSKEFGFCKLCGAQEEDQPDSHANEVSEELLKKEIK